MEKKEQQIQNSILFLGNRDDVCRLYQAMDVFVLTSRYEGLPVVGVEAQAAGLPCVLSNKMTKETKINDNFKFESINEKSCVWAKDVLQFEGEKRHSGGIDKKFDIRHRAGDLAYYYEILLNIYNKA